MNRAELEKRLEYGEQWGFRKETNDPKYLGWILVSKRKPPIMYPEHAYSDREQYERLVELSKERTQNPYHVIVEELRRDVHESGVYENGEDYEHSDNYYLSTLDDVENLIESLGYSLEEIKGRGELDAP